MSYKFTVFVGWRIMALVWSLNSSLHKQLQQFCPRNPSNSRIESPKFSFINSNYHSRLSFPANRNRRRWPQKWGSKIINSSEKESIQSSSPQDEEVDNLGVRAALCILTFYKREISPLLPKSCRFVPTCSEYSMIAYKKYGFVKGTVLTTWRLCRCNPLGGSGFDPPRWFDETSTKER